jgi:Protein of unknown function (DUF4232)
MHTTPPAALPITGPITGAITGHVTGHVTGHGTGRGSGRSRGRHAVSLTVAAVAASGLLAACASTSTQQAGTVPKAANTPAGGAATSGGKTGTPGRTTAASPAGTRSSSSGTAGLPACQPASLQVTVNASQAGGTAGSTYYPVDFTNTSSSPCGLYGYPGMSFVTAGDSGGRQIGAAAQQNPGFGKVAVRLAAGGMAHAWLQVAEAGNYPASTCQPVTAHWLRVFAPGETQAQYVNHAFDACSSASAPLLTVMPLRSGQGVQGTAP